MKHLGDITKIHGDQIEPVDCITFGSPCQDLSIAGRRAGLAGERSGLFMEAVRIIKEMRSSTNGLHPTFAIWENVPGAFSSNGGEDFRAVLEELARVEQPDVSIPRPSGRGGRWSKAGAIAGNGWSLAWRQLDAQYWGVPQRRKRIALVADFGGQRASEILFERTGVSGNLEQSIPTWQEVTGAAGSRIAGNDRPVPVLNDQGGGVMGVSYNVTGTLRASEHGHQPIVLESNQVHATVSQTGICPTLPASMGLGGGYVPMVTERKIFDARGNGSECLVAEKTVRWIVRRLTPVECERLQGYPSGWTDIGEWTDTKGKKHKYADSPRYKALGNSIALPQWFWIAQKMKPYLSTNAMLGSLFDGIGGFPLVWQKTYGNGTARWASEVDSFCIAVTKKRFSNVEKDRWFSEL